MLLEEDMRQALGGPRCTRAHLLGVAWGARYSDKEWTWTIAEAKCWLVGFTSTISLDVFVFEFFPQ